MTNRSLFGATRAVLVTVAFAACVTACAASAEAQSAAPNASRPPELRVAGAAGARTITGAMSAGAVFPLSALQQLGGIVRTDRFGGVVDIFGDSIRFWTGSPFFRAGGELFQLAYAPVQIIDAFHLPEQFFVQWLPLRYATTIEYNGGVVRLRDARVATQDSITIAPRPQSSTQQPASATTPPASAARPTAAPPPVATPPLAGTAAPVTSGARANPPASTPASTKSAKRIVVIDPGHGGTDPGSMGPNKLREKDAALMISNRLASLLRSRGYEVHMTRTRDTLISLADRPRLANQWKGDEPGALYISIHTNSGVPQARGYETYFLSDASTEDERRVAEMENAAVKYEQRPRAASDLDQVLNGLRNDFYLKASNAFADVVQRGMRGFHPGTNRGVKRAPFRVLVGALMPAVLVEVAFISNPGEADLLGSSSFQDKVAFSIAESVDTFFRDNEPLWIRQ